MSGAGSRGDLPADLRGPETADWLAGAIERRAAVAGIELSESNENETKHD